MKKPKPALPRILCGPRSKAGMELRLPSSSSSSSSFESPSKEPLDVTLALLGFEFDEISPQVLSGRLPVTEKICQPLKLLQGGVSALIAESLASIGAHLASGLKRVAGFSVNIHHVKNAKLGDLVLAQATPISVGRTVQVWEVSFWKMDSSNPKNKTIISTARVSVLCHLPIRESDKGAIAKYRKYAKL